MIPTALLVWLGKGGLKEGDPDNPPLCVCWGGGGEWRETDRE